MSFTAIYPGSFDPVTIGHLDVATRASAIADKLIIGILINPGKKYIFTAEQRAEHLRRCTGHLKNVEVEIFSGLMADFYKKSNARAIIRGLRDMTEYERERVVATVNGHLHPGLETLFIPCNPAYLHISSSCVKELAYLGGDFSDMVPDFLCEPIRMALMQTDLK